MYLFVTKIGSVYQSKKVNQNELDAVELGALNIFDISDVRDFKQYTAGGVWIPIEEWNLNINNPY